MAGAKRGGSGEHARSSLRFCSCLLQGIAMIAGMFISANKPICMKDNKHENSYVNYGSYGIVKLSSFNNRLANCLSFVDNCDDD